MSLAPAVGDFIIVDIVAGKRAMARCTSVSESGKRYKAILETEADKQEPAIEFKASAIVANLGRAPQNGSVYGLKVEPVRERLESTFWGGIQIHHVLDDNQRNVLRKAMSEVSTKLKAMKLPKLALETQIRTQVGKNLGYYKFRPKADTDIVCVRVDDDMSDIPYRFAHEYAHGIWFRNFTPKMKMAWVNMFHSAVQLSSYSDKDLQQLLDDVKSNGDVRSFAKENPDDLPVLKAVFRHIKQTHAMDRSHFEMALMLGEEVDAYWPSSLELGEKQVLLTDYAKKAPEELWAETFSVKFVGKKLPHKLEDLHLKCMTRLVK